MNAFIFLLVSMFRKTVYHSSLNLDDLNMQPDCHTASNFLLLTSWSASDDLPIKIVMAERELNLGFDQLAEHSVSVGKI